MDQLFLVIAIGVLVAAGMYMYFPLAKKVKLLSFTWGSIYGAFLGLCIYVTLFAFPEAPWNFSLSLIACFFPAFHGACKYQEKQFTVQVST